MLHYLLVVAWALVCCLRPTASATSKAWGTNGSSYNRQRLLDYSYAGYAAGERAIPTLTPTTSVKSFGAKGDGVTDDTKAFEAAIASTTKGVIRIPAGKYVLTRRLVITKRISLIGDGSGSTTLIFPRSLDSIYGAGNLPEFAQSFITFKGMQPHTFSKRVGRITANAGRGSNNLVLSSISGLKVGNWVSVTISSPHTNFMDMNHGLHQGCITNFCLDNNNDDANDDVVAYSFQSRVARVISSSRTLVLERPLPWNITSDYSTRSVYRFEPLLANVGIQGLSLEMKSGRYEGHFMYNNWNAIHFERVINGWIRDIVITNADSGIYVFRSHFITVTGITLKATRARLSTGYRPGYTGHWGISLKTSVDCLVDNYTLSTKFIHDNAVDKFARGNVFSRGRGIDLNMDMHKGQTYGTLFTQINTGAGTRAFEDGGTPSKGLAAGSFTTFWNVVGSQTPLQGPLETNYGPWLTFIGVKRFLYSKNKYTNSWYVESITPSDLVPANIYLAQRGLRLGSANRVSSVLGGRGSGGVLLTTL